jgi:molybdate transport system ATP-binding protein
MMKTIEITNAKTKKPEWSMTEPVNFSLDEGEHIAIVGRNGAGKSMFVDIITGRHPAFPNMVKYAFDEPYNNIKHITFRDTYGGDNDRTYFLQQRWNQMEISDDAPRVSDALDEAYNLCGADTQQRREFREKIYRLFGIDALQGKLLLMLSSGEMRKLQLVKTLMAEPKVLIMDNPFIGLDAGTREQLRQLLETITSELRLQTILILSKTNDIPD